jgi:hypothetical protein
VGVALSTKRRTHSYAPLVDVWTGENYERTADRIMILGESWYGDIEPLATYVPRWAGSEINDHMFSRLFNAASGSHTDHATHKQRLDWWNGIAFYNFVPGSVGASRSDKPSIAAFEAAREPLTSVLERLCPRGVWIIGKGQAEYSAEVVRRFGSAYEVTPQTSSYGLSTAALAGSWHRLLEAVRALPQT